MLADVREALGCDLESTVAAMQRTVVYHYRFEVVMTRAGVSRLDGALNVRFSDSRLRCQVHFASAKGDLAVTWGGCELASQ